MSATVYVKGEPVTYDAEADAGITLDSGKRWWGTRVKWRRGTAGRWHRFTLVDVHPMDADAIEAGLVAYLDGSYRR